MRSLPKIIKRRSSEEIVEQYQLQDNLIELAMQIEQEKKKKNEPPDKKRDEAEADDAFAGPSPEELQAQQIIDRAMQQSNSIIASAKEESLKIKKEAYDTATEKGYEDGYNSGKKEAYDEYTKKLDADREAVKADVAAIMEEVTEQKDRLLAQYLTDLKDISISIAEKIMQVSLKSSGDIIKRMIVSATHKMKKTQWVKIYISKYDAEVMTQGDSQFLESLAYLSDNIKIITMEKSDSGTCIIETPKAVMDVSMNTQIENIKDLINNVPL